VRTGLTWKWNLSGAAAIAIVLLGLMLPGPARSQDSERAKAQALVDAAIKMTQSDQAVKLLWQATEIDPTFNDAYLYLGLYYNSREDFGKVVEVYKKLVQYQPKGDAATSAYLNIGEAYLSFKPPQYDDALPYYRKAYELDSGSALAALRIGEIMANQGNRAEAARYLQQASSDSGKDSAVAAEAQKLLAQIGSAP
jgi:tetratricopeptide (TPR) repeat protein